MRPPQRGASPFTLWGSKVIIVLDFDIEHDLQGKGYPHRRRDIGISGDGISSHPFDPLKYRLVSEEIFQCLGPFFFELWPYL